MAEFANLGILIIFSLFMILQPVFQILIQIYIYIFFLNLMQLKMHIFVAEMPLVLVVGSNIFSSNNGASLELF